MSGPGDDVSGLAPSGLREWTVISVPKELVRFPSKQELQVLYLGRMWQVAPDIPDHLFQSPKVSAVQHRTTVIP